jgi:hypothetical protein
MACWLCAHHKINVSLCIFWMSTYTYIHSATILQHESVLSIILPDEATGKSIDLVEVDSCKDGDDGYSQSHQ